MAGVKISNLPPIVTPAVTDIFPVVQGGVTYKMTFTQLSSLFLLLAGGTMTGDLILFSSSPPTALSAASKGYVDSVATGLNIQASCKAATTANLTATYSNGTSGVGATLTNSGALAAFSVDGYSASLNDRILVKNQSTSFQNGIYTVTTVGSGAVAWVLTRATDYDTPAEIQPGDFVLVINGTVNAQTQWVETATVTTIGTDAITWDQFGADINALQTAIQNNSYVYCEDTGAADAYVATPSPAITSYVEGQVFILDPDNANATATPTLNVSGLGVKTIVNDQGGALVAGDIIPSLRAYLLYDGTNFRLVNRNYEKRIQNESFNYILDTGAADAYVATLVPAVTAYVTGLRLSLKIANANLTTTPTVNVNGLGAVTIVREAATALAVGDLPTGFIADLRYDGTNFQLLNPVSPIAASQAEQETGTSVVKAVTPGRQQYHPSAAKVWVLYNTVTSTAIVVSYNVTSLTDNGAGDTTVNFTVSFSSGNYSYVGMGNNGLGHATIVEQDLGVTAPATGSCRMITTRMSTDAAEDMNGASVAYYGDQ